MTLAVWLAELTRAQQVWDDQADTLYGARSSLRGAETGLLGPRVAAAADAFVSTWTDAVGALRDDAEAHAEALTRARIGFLHTEEETVAEIQALLPWESRSTRPEGGW